MGADKPDESTLSPEMKEHYDKFEKMIKEHTEKFSKKMREHSAHFKQKFQELLEQQKNAQLPGSEPPPWRPCQLRRLLERIGMARPVPMFKPGPVQTRAP